MNPKLLRSILIIAILFPTSIFFGLGPIKPANALPVNSRTIGLLIDASGWHYSFSGGGFDTNPPITVYEDTSVTMFLDGQDSYNHTLVISTPTPISSPLIPVCCPVGGVAVFTFTATPIGTFTYCDESTSACGTFQVKQRGDVDGDGDADSADVATIVSYLGASLPADWSIGDKPYPDGRVDATDLAVVARFFDSPGGPAPYHPDVNEDGVVDIYDASIVAGLVGTSSAAPFNDPNQGPDVNYDNRVDSSDIPATADCYQHSGDTLFKTWGGSGEDLLFRLATDAFGNIYATGYTDSFGAGSRDVILLKYDNSSCLLWQKTWGGGGNEVARSIALDSLGNIYVTGETESFGAGNGDIFLLKFSPSGDLVWEKSWGGSDPDGRWNVGMALSSDAVYVTGETQSFGAGGEDVFLLKFDPDGNLLWQLTWGDANDDLGSKVALDSSGYVYVTGITGCVGGCFDFNGGDAFLLKFDPQGNLLRQQTWGSSGEDYAFDLASDSSNNIYMTGRTRSFGAGAQDVFLLKFDPIGDLVRQQTWGGGNDEHGYNVIVDSIGSVYVTGGTISFGAGDRDVFLLKFDSAGSLVSQNRWGAPGSDDVASGLAFDPYGDLIVNGAVSAGPPYTLSLTSGSVGNPTFPTITPSFPLSYPTFALGSPSGTVSAPPGSETYAGGSDGFFFRSVPDSEPDIDGDGIPDQAELSPAMQALGADPCRKTVAVEADYMVPGDHTHTHRPRPEAIGMVADAFDAAPVTSVPLVDCPYATFPRRPTGIQLIVDIGQEIPEQEPLTFLQGSPETFESIKATHFNLARVDYWHYSLWVHDLAIGSSVSGIADFHGNDLIVALGSWRDEFDNPCCGTANEQAGTFMHELGHNVGLRHGGGDNVNFKPNYLSVMNYAFQTVGVKAADGTSRLKYSVSKLATLDETNLNEAAGIGTDDYTSWSCTGKEAELTAIGNSGLDWNCSGPIDPPPVQSDINGDRTCIKPGPDGTLDSTAMGDDQVVGSQIHDGDNRTCQSSVSGDDELKRPIGNLEPNLLEGFDDWNAIDYIFRDNPENYFGHTTVDTGHTTVDTGRAIPETELTFEEAKKIESFWAEFSSLQVTQSFSSPLKLDSHGSPKVDVILANGVVTSTNPGQVTVQIRITNRAGSSLASLRLAEVLPVDWRLSPFDQPVRIYFESAGHVRVELTTGVSVLVAGSPQTVRLSISDISATEAGKKLDPGESIVVFVKMDYALKGTRQPAGNYPIPYSAMATATAYSRISYEGTGVQSYQSILFMAYARVLGGGGRARST